eukprot:GHVU01142978.1.p1 GENE.GHVU01142978.1~~GHVU01142978.1.p1  ORF type:complete len:172 (-),score=0.84 GHVU01142978.1:109-624(-)
MYLYNALWLFRFRGLVLELGHSMSEVVPVFQVGSCGFMRSETPFLLCIPAQGYAVPEASVCCRAAGETASIRLMELIRDSENWKNYQRGTPTPGMMMLKCLSCLTVPSSRWSLCCATVPWNILSGDGGYSRLLSIYSSTAPAAHCDPFNVQSGPPGMRRRKQQFSSRRYPG